MTDLERDLWIRRFTPGPPGTARLVCFPHAGGSAPFYLPVSRALAPVADVLAVQYPGRQERRTEKCLDSIGELADRIGELLLPLADRPLVLFGHSMGATLAFEVACRLREHGIVPRHLVVSGRRAPSRRRDEWVHTLDDAGIIAEMAALSGTDRAILGNPDLLRMILPALRGDYRAIETYRFPGGAPLSCPITALTGDADPRVTPDEVEAWKEHTSDAFDLRVFPGGHFFLTHHQEQILDLLRSRLETTS
ncbi:thioesterase II family protein [Pseudosporangium ferrugineum]|uniref:Surfactin synthase thioesterase subunit n=1 Tax=Pseudosporangium ferrugineum TaxID=439699 RepID=A0A2T0RJP1_9ACTN|nr:alpha/beta fold hydrolase [Pseudosporangium ferrugineum]PRY21330.1 surfactin synthase thioesterase subunit [Pseudosporangium ferrugineum]